MAQQKWTSALEPDPTYACRPCLVQMLSLCPSLPAATVLGIGSLERLMSGLGTCWSGVNHEHSWRILL